MKLLIADDDRTTRIILRKAIRGWGYEIVEASDGTSAWEHLRGPCPPRIAVLDWMMPRLDGIELCARLSHRESGPLIYSILLTASTDTQDLVHALDSGAHDFLSKPVSASELRSRIEVGRRLVEAEDTLSDYARNMQQLAERLSSQFRFQKTLLNSIPTPIFVRDAAGTLIDCNGSFARCLGEPPETLIGTLVEELEPAGPLGLHDQQLLARPGTRTYEATFSWADGTTHTMVIHKASFTASGDNGGGVIGVLLDITDRKRLETKLQHLATTDELTGIANRRRFFDLARSELGDARRRSRPLALLLLDIDHFKVINDTYGHAAGDETLKVTASICERDLRDRDVLARIGGEELAIILPETDLKVATEVAERLRARIAATRVKFSERKIRFTVSIGVTERNDLDRSVHSLLLRADKALYEAKRAGRDRIASTP